MRVLLYERVSHEEQVKFGLSIDTQIERLHDWAQRNGHTIVGEFTELGVSARKPAAKRPELQKLLASLNTAELVAFTKLDRWSRNIKEYYKVQEVLDRYHVAWEAIDEDYETVTASGRMKVNIMLAVNENEADRTSERTKVINEGKVARGEAITGSTPRGYSIKDKHLVPNEDADAMRALFRQYQKTGSIGAARRYLQSEYGITLYISGTKSALRNTLYKGEYRGNINYCEPIIPPEEFDEVQRLLAHRSVRQNQTGQVYLFSGLLICSECGAKMVSRSSNGGASLYYRCQRACVYHKCTNHKHLNEKTIEAWLLAHVKEQLENQEYEYTVKQKQKKQVDRAAVKQKMDRLADLYIDGKISKGKYDRDYAALAEMLAKAPKNFEATRKLVGDAIGEIYSTLTREEKRRLWRAILEKVIVTPAGGAFIFFNR